MAESIHSIGLIFVCRSRLIGFVQVSGQKLEVVISILKPLRYQSFKTLNYYVSTFYKSSILPNFSPTLSYTHTLQPLMMIGWEPWSRG